MRKWISIKERFPDDSINEILITNGKSTYVAVKSIYFNGAWKNNENPLEIDWTYSACCGCHASGITHWMPVPEPPEECLK